MAVDRDDVRIGDADFEQPFPYELQQFLGFLVHLGPLQFRILLLEFVQPLGIAGAGLHLDLPADQFLGAGGPVGPQAVNHLLADFLIGRAEPDQFAPRLRHRDPRRRQVGIALEQPRDDVVEFFGDHETRFHAEIVGEAFHQIVFEPGRSFRHLVISGGAGARQHHQFAGGFDVPQLVLLEKGAGQELRENQQNQQGRTADSERGVKYPGWLVSPDTIHRAKPSAVSGACHVPHAWPKQRVLV